MNAKTNLVWTLLCSVLLSLSFNAFASCTSCNSCKSCTCKCSCPCATTNKCTHSPRPTLAKHISHQSREQVSKKYVVEKQYVVKKQNRVAARKSHPIQYKYRSKSARRSAWASSSSLQSESSLMPTTLPYRWYFSVGAEAYDAQFDGVTTGLVRNGQLMGAMNSSTVKKPLYQLRVGYQWANDFGTQKAIEFKGDYGKFNTSQRGGTMDGIRIFYIDGSEQVKEQEWNVDYTQLSEKHEVLDLSLYFKGKKLVSPNFSFSPYVGLFYGQDNAKENVDIGYYFQPPTPPPPPPPIEHLRDAIQQKVDTNYYGAGIGSKFSFLTTKRISPFFEVEGQLLEAKATLDSHQAGVIDKDGHQFDIKDLHVSKSKTTYRLIGTVGVEYRFMESPLSWKLILKGGVDKWGYKPQVKMPIHESQRVYIADNHVSNPFFGLELFVPLD